MGGTTAALDLLRGSVGGGCGVGVAWCARVGTRFPVRISVVSEKSRKKNDKLIVVLNLFLCKLRIYIISYN